MIKKYWETGEARFNSDGTVKCDPGVLRPWEEGPQSGNDIEAWVDDDDGRRAYPASHQPSEAERLEHA